jgi:hypothetical protein
MEGIPSRIHKDGGEGDTGRMKYSGIQRNANFPTYLPC